MNKLVVREAEKTVRGIKVLDGVSVACESGRILGLCGANGSGKTMLMRAMSGLMYLDKGVVSYNSKQLGHDLDFVPRAGILIENPAFLGRYTALENLRYIASIAGGISDDAIRSCIAFVGLNPDDKRVYRQFSLGMKQRLGIAAAILGKPDVVFLDEPTNALDETGYALMDRVAADIVARGAIGVIASHDAQMSRRVADEIVRMQDGCVVQRHVRRVIRARDAAGAAGASGAVGTAGAPDAAEGVQGA